MWCGAVVSWVDVKTDVWVRKLVGVLEDAELVAQLKRGIIATYGQWKRRSHNLLSRSIEGGLKLLFTY